MRKILSILFAILIIFSVLHISVASHYCCGELAAVKFSLTGKHATCGMETATTSCPAHNSVKSNCCKNKVSVFAVDHSYNYSSYQIHEIYKTTTPVFNIPNQLQLTNFNANNYIFAANSPPLRLLISSVDITNICVFRI